jgi:16S rRNA (cytosine1402-N4)-methyltransferase
MPYDHVPVMPLEVERFLNCKPGKIIADCTLGGAGHAKAIVEKIVPDGLMIGIDQDADAIKNAKKILEPFSANISLFHDNFVNFPKILSELGIKAVDGILLDLGLSRHHIEKSGRGFSFRKDEPLDMRMDIRSGILAKDLVNKMDAKGLERIFFEFGEEKRTKQIVRSIVKQRAKKEIQSSKELARIVSDAIARRASKVSRIHPATRVFMALRIAVNKELEQLSLFMEGVADFLNPQGRLCVLSFHSLEDRIVKRRMKFFEKGCICPPDFPKCICNKEKVFRILTKKVLRPTEKEVAVNPMARSTKLRVAERI